MRSEEEIREALRRVPAIQAEARVPDRSARPLPAPVVPTPTVILCGWTVSLSHDPRAWPKHVVALQDFTWVPKRLRRVAEAQRDLYAEGKPVWVLSARLHPDGRGSTPEDWHFIGRLAAAFGAPKDPTTPLAETHPNETHYWVWGEGAADAVLAAVS